MWADRCGEGVVVRLRVVTDDLDALAPADRIAAGLLEIPVPKLRGSGTSSMKRVPCTTCAGASMWVVTCMVAVVVCESTPDFAM
jgi:hypothetical protein